MNNPPPVAPVVTEEMVLKAAIAYEDQMRMSLKTSTVYIEPLKAAITAALQASGELERLRAALHKAQIEREYWRGFAVQTKQQVEGFVKKLQDWTNEGELIQGGYNAST